MKHTIIVWCLFLTITAFAKSIVLVSPNNGGTFSPGQSVPVKWASNDISNIYVEFSLDNGLSWSSVDHQQSPDTGVFIWQAPYLHKQADHARLRVREGTYIKGLTDMSDSSFVILAAPPDAYEPNNNFLSAYQIPVGDSVVKNAMVFGLDPRQDDSIFADHDFFKVTLQSENLTTISVIPWDTCCFAEKRPCFRLYDSTQSLVYFDTSAEAPFRLDGYHVAVSGTYYLDIYNRGYFDFYTISEQWTGSHPVKYGLSIHQDPESLTMVSPNGNETFSAGQSVPIQWTRSNMTANVVLEYSLDSGAHWKSVEQWGRSISNTGTYTWQAPYLKKQVDKAFIRVRADNAAQLPSDVSDANFVISAAPNDGYEPNDDFLSAYPISPGDSAVKNATVFGGGFSETDSLLYDLDFFKVTLDSGKAAIISVTAEGQFLGRTVYDSSKSQVYPDPNREDYVPFFPVTKSGTYYLEIRNNTYSAIKYGISIQQRALKALTLVSPNGGETFSAGQLVTIRWRADTLLSDFSLWYSLNNGISWIQINEANSTDTCWWLVPPLKQRTDRALVKVIVEGITDSISGVSNGNFTILASAPDAYEPNDDFASAYPVTVGDSVVKNATIGASDTGSGDTSIVDSDVDYFKVTLTKKIATFSVFWAITNDYTKRNKPFINIRLYDSLKNEISRTFSPYYSIPVISGYKISRPGTYYCVISTYTGYGAEYCMSIRQTDEAVSLISPNGGETFTPGQEARIVWTAEPIIPGADFFYSKDNGTSWTKFASFPRDSENIYWIVPPIRPPLNQVLIKASASNDSTLFDISNGTFSIAPEPPDAYEPNNDFVSAYPIAVGDSVVKNATVCGYDKAKYDSFDVDEFKVSLSAAKLTTISTIPMYPKRGGGYCYGGFGCKYSFQRDGSSYCVGGNQCESSFNGKCPMIFLYKSNTMMGGMQAVGEKSITYITPESGVYYVGVYGPGFGWWVKYGLSIRSVTILSRQTCVLDTDAMQPAGDSSMVAYKLHLFADTTKLTIDFTFKQKVKRPVITMVLAPDEIAFAPNTKVKVKVVSILDSVSSSIKTADITIPYAPSDLGGYPEQMLEAFWLNDTTFQWTPCASTIDTMKHQMTVHGMHAGTYGLFIKSNTPIAFHAIKRAPILGIQANFSSQKQCIAVHFSLPQAVNAELRLYNIQGKCVRRSMFAAGLGSSTLLWNLGALANGKYFLVMNAGAYCVKEAIVMMN